MRDKSSIRPLKFAPPLAQPLTTKINRNIALIEFHSSFRKQRINKKSIATFPAHPALQESFPALHTPNPTPSPINRHTFLLEFPVSPRKRRTFQNLIATRIGVFPPHPNWLTSHTLALFLTHSPASCTSSTSSNSFASYLTRLCVTISGGEAPCRT